MRERTFNIIIITLAIIIFILGVAVVYVFVQGWRPQSSLSNITVVDNSSDITDVNEIRSFDNNESASAEDGFPIIGEQEVSSNDMFEDTESLTSYRVIANSKGFTVYDFGSTPSEIQYDPDILNGVMHSIKTDGEIIKGFTTYSASDVFHQIESSESGDCELLYGYMSPYNDWINLYIIYVVDGDFCYTIVETPKGSTCYREGMSYDEAMDFIAKRKSGGT